jgi:dienelactone hydrolase
MERKSIKKLLVLAIISLFLLGVAVTSYAQTCPSGAICRPEAPGNYSGNGPYGSASYQLPTTSYSAGATVYYPTSATAPFAAIVFMQPYTGTQSMDEAWGPFFASHGIVYVNCSTNTTGDSVDSRATQQANAVAALKSENTRTGTTLRPNPLKGKLDISRIGLMGWSMGGGATWINSATAGYKTAMTLAGHNATATSIYRTGRYTKCATMIFSGLLDTTILGGLGQSEGVYSNIPSTISKVHYQVAGAGHMVWGSPTSAGNYVARIALAFQKTYLDGDTRWKSYIARPIDASIWNASLK